jgi:hypothetical protein
LKLHVFDRDLLCNSTFSGPAGSGGASMWIWILRVAKSPLAKRVALALLAVAYERINEDD